MSDLGSSDDSQSEMESMIVESDEDTSDWDAIHVAIRSTCGLCSQLITPHEWAIALLNGHGDRHGTCLSYCTKSFRFPEIRGIIVEGGSFPLCNEDRCRDCKGSPESVTMHSECYCLFLQTYHDKPALERVWVAAAWRIPWVVRSSQSMPHIGFIEPGLVSISSSAAEGLGIPQLATLPSEVLQLIVAYSRGSLVWRYPIIIARAEELSRVDESSSKDDGMLYNLSTVKKWHRGQDAEFDEDPPESFVFRLTLDSHGLLDIERLPEWPEYKSCVYRTYKYFFLDSDEAERTLVYFRFGHARMKLSPSLSRPVQLWDIPSPPNPSTKGLELLLVPHGTDATCIRTLDLRNITGITFFYYRGTLMGLHAHTPEDPIALTTVKEILSDYEPNLVWIYMPIAHGDRIVRFGLRTWRNDREEPASHHMALLMTTKLAGDFSLGPNFDEEDMNYFFRGTPTVLFHNMPAKGGITLLGLAGDKTQERLLAPRFPIISLSMDQLINGGDAITVDISLKNAVRIDIFSERSTGYLRGFILEYTNGAKRSAGQCRVGIDPVMILESQNSRDMSDHSLPDAPQSPRDVIYDPDRLDWEDLIQGDDGEHERHICLQDQCDLCPFDMAPGDLSIALTCETHLRPSYCTKLFRFPAGNGEFQPGGETWILCRDAKCNHSSEVVTMHASCYQLFFQHYTHDNPLNGVWIATEWRHYFSSQLGFKLEDNSILSVSPSIAESLGMPQLALLPPTLVQDIRSMSPDSEVWAYLAIKDLAERISSAAGQDDMSCMLDKVESWTRGEGEPVMSDSFAGDWSMRVTTDRRGIRNIERIAGVPSYEDWRSESLAFALIPPDKAMKSCVDFRLGAARLDLWGGSTRGLTFFYDGSSLRAIHSHTSRFPTALTTYARLPKLDRKHVVWAHVPIAPNDRIIGLGIRTSGMEDGFTSPSVLIRTELAGDIVIGPQPKPVSRDLALVLIKDYTCGIIPEFLAYGLPPTDGEHMLFAVGARSTEPNEESTRRFPRTTSSTITHSCSCPLLRAQIPLQGTTRIDVFTCKATGLCRGMIFGYEDGAQRAVGQCRMGIDNVTTHINPTRICYSDTMRAHCCAGDDNCSNEEYEMNEEIEQWEEIECTAHQGSRVECSSGTDEHHHNDSGEHMVCIPIKGYLDCHWDDRWTRLDIQERAPEAVAAIMQVDMNGRNPLEFTV
ncbi:hypothetical protein FDENT_4599 [Fusarium denticulatum]|uniref:Uncharacterized protein n=1 Tax=Fusarium denticulatum TaxID=48507 RepID=A0A8H5UG09_9HYPO|nr:hypothetical protein FDENT_4599 [Fusarium denticulatum]